MISVPFKELYKNKIFIDFLDNKLIIKPASKDNLNLFWEKAKEIFSYSYKYQSLRDTLIKQNEEFLKENPQGEILISLLKKGNYLCVITGQQPGLGGGPLYTLYKALTAIKLAKWIQANINIPCIPIFWVVSEDHDISECTTISLLNNDWNLVKINEKSPPSLNNQMANSIFCSSKFISVILNKLKASLPDTLYSNDVKQLITNSYYPNFNISIAFIKFMQTILKDFPILFFDPSEDTFKKNISQILFRLTEDYSAIFKILSETTLKIKDNKYSPPIKLKKNQLPFFFIENNKRIPLILEDKVYLKGSHKIFPLHNFLKLIIENPLKFSPNVISRPLIQDSLLPNIAYIGGPTEISYLYQIYPLYEYLKIPFPILIPRHSATLIFKKASKILKKYNIQVPEILLNQKLLITSTETEEVKSLFNSFKEQLSFSLKSFFDELKRKKINMLEKEQETVKRIMDYIEKFKNRCLVHCLQSNQVFQKHINILYNSLKPYGDLQERQLSIINLLNLEGKAAINCIYENIDIFEFKHFIYELL